MRNVFVSDAGGKWGVELAGSAHSEVVHNRFVGLAVGVYARTRASHVVVAGNVFEKCARPLSAVNSKGVVVVDRSAKSFRKTTLTIIPSLHSAAGFGIIHTSLRSWPPA